MEDPIFDPWGPSKPVAEPVAESAPEERPTRWRSTSSGQGMPVSRPLPSPIPPTAPAAVRLLIERVLPRLMSITQRLDVAGHTTTLDDRLAHEGPSLRFRVRPRKGAFDDPRPDDGAVLEFLPVEGSGGNVEARLWLDPLSTVPGEVIQVRPEKLTTAWVDQLVLDFVGKALQQG
jgi:hypothetical protein